MVGTVPALSHTVFGSQVNLGRFERCIDKLQLLSCPQRGSLAYSPSIVSPVAVVGLFHEEKQAPLIFFQIDCICEGENFLDYFPGQVLIQNLPVLQIEVFSFEELFQHQNLFVASSTDNVIFVQNLECVLVIDAFILHL